MPEDGYIYLLINSSMPNLIKVGKTKRDVQDRANELSTATGVPTPFVVAFDAYFDDCDNAEILIHKELEKKGSRVVNNREFFLGPLKEIINLVLDLQKSLNPPGSAMEKLAFDTHMKNGQWEEAYKLLKQAVEVGSRTAYYGLGFLLGAGYGCAPDIEASLDCWQKGYDLGDSRCSGWFVSYYRAKVDALLRVTPAMAPEVRTLAKNWFIKYLESDAVFNVVNHSREMHVLDGCVALEDDVDYRRNILMKYKERLFPFKDTLLDFTVRSGETSKDEARKRSCLMAAQDIQSILIEGKSPSNDKNRTQIEARQYDANAVHRDALESYQASGVVKFVEILPCGDPLVCEACKEIANKQYEFSAAPELPYKNCTSEDGCRCTYIPIVCDFDD